MKPESAKSFTSFPCCLAMNPSTEKITNPEKMLVNELMAAITNVSLSNSVVLISFQHWKCLIFVSYKAHLIQPHDIVVIWVVASQSYLSTDPYGIRVQYLSQCITPNLVWNKIFIRISMIIVLTIGLSSSRLCGYF